MLRNLRDFMFAVLSDTVAVMSSTASVALWIWGYFANDPNVAHRLLWPVAAVCLFYACFRAWRTERKAAQEKDADLLDEKHKNQELREEVRRGREPDLRGEFVQAVFHYVGDRPGCGLLLWVEIRNRGADSIAERYSLTATTDSGRALHPQLQTLPAEITLPSGQVLYGRDNLYDRTALEPIKRGAKAAGILWAWFDDAGQEEARHSKMTLTFSDVNGKKYTVEGHGGGPEGQLRHIPGLTLPGHAQEPQGTAPAGPQPPQPPARDR